MSERIELGQEVRDTVTGLQGIATGRIEYLGGSASVQVQATTFEKGLPVAAVWIEEARLEIVQPTEVEAPDTTAFGDPTGAGEEAEAAYPTP